MSNAVSFSRAQTYKKCPASYEWQYILGNRDDSGPGPAARRGTEIHKTIEDFHNDVGSLHEEIPLMIAKHINKYYDVPGWKAYPEFEWALTETWEACGFNDEHAYIRGYMDNLFVRSDDMGSVVEVVIDEYKTGQIYDEHAEQKALYAMVSLILYPTVEEVEVYGVYIDKKKVEHTRYSRLHLPSMQYTWKRQIEKMKVGIYPARPGMHCRWCTKSKKAGGPCQLG